MRGRGLTRARPGHPASTRVQAAECYLGLGPRSFRVLGSRAIRTHGPPSSPGQSSGFSGFRVLMSQGLGFSGFRVYWFRGLKV